MPSVYAVTPQDVSAELRGLIPAGFANDTVPSLAEVSVWITAADIAAQLAVQREATGTPAATDAAAPLAQEYIINRVLARVVRVLYVGRGPEFIADAVRPYLDAAKAAYHDLELLGEAAIGATVEVSGPKVWDYSGTAVTSLRGPGTTAAGDAS